ncbi:MAG: hypothetical protein GY821_03515, partial [Gammaproteobacteria bacterium]|nr:hypothetical protein [Gammaproteobacteria bacterium]
MLDYANKKKSMKVPLMVDDNNEPDDNPLNLEVSFKKRCAKGTFSCLSTCASYFLNALHKMAKDTESLLYLWISFSALNTTSDQNRQYEILGNSSTGESGATVYYSPFIAYGILEFYYTFRSRLTRNNSLRDYVGQWHAVCLTTIIIPYGRHAQLTHFRAHQTKEIVLDLRHNILLFLVFFCSIFG